MHLFNLRQTHALINTYIQTPVYFLLYIIENMWFAIVPQKLTDKYILSNDP